MLKLKNTITNHFLSEMKFHDSFFIPLMAALCLIGNLSGNGADYGDAPVTHGVAIGAVEGGNALFWSRTDREAIMHLAIESEDGGSVLEKTTPATAYRDFTGKIKVSGFKADTLLSYRVWFTVENPESGKKHPAFRGKIRTAPSAVDGQAVSFAWSGDVAGQNVCRDAEEGFPAFKVINSLPIDFFIGLGDMIYADNTCEGTGKYGNRQVTGNFRPSANMKDYWEHWKYNRDDPGYQQLLAQTPYFVIWDDHEVVNDFGPLQDTREEPPYIPGEHLLPLGRRAFEDYNPIEENPDSPHRLYYNIRWGLNLELFFLDNRQYRDAKNEADDPAHHKTMLGREQVVWLKEKLGSSNALWKVIISSVPMSIPTGSTIGERDGWANYDQETGYENELLDIIGFMKGLPQRNFVWLTTDVHFAEVFRYTPYKDDPSFKLYELVVGPLNAGLFPNRKFDLTLNPESLFFHGPETADSVTTWEEAKKWFNFGVISIDEGGKLTASVRDTVGKILYQTRLQPER